MKTLSQLLIAHCEKNNITYTQLSMVEGGSTCTCPKYLNDLECIHTGLSPWIPLEKQVTESIQPEIIGRYLISDM